MSDPTALPNFPPPPDEHPLRGRVLDALQDMGTNPNIDSDGDVAFTANEQQLFVRCTDGDVTIMRTFGQWQIGDPVPADPLRQLAACNEVNLSMNLVKTGLANDSLVVLTEHLVRQGEDISGILNVSVQVVLGAVHLWHQRILGETGEDGEPGASGGPDQPGRPSGEPTDGGARQ